MTKPIVVGLVACVLLVQGCAALIDMQARMIPRDSETVYVGKIVADGTTATMDIEVDGERYSGSWVRATTDDSLDLIQQFGTRGGSAGPVAAGRGTRMNKGTFSSPGGRALRCESTATGMGGSGICVDDKSRVFDITVSLGGPKIASTQSKKPEVVMGGTSLEVAKGTLIEQFIAGGYSVDSANDTLIQLSKPMQGGSAAGKRYVYGGLTNTFRDEVTLITLKVQSGVRVYAQPSWSRVLNGQRVRENDNDDGVFNEVQSILLRAKGQTQQR